MGLAVWRYEVANIVFEKRILLPHRQNTVRVNYRLVEGAGPVRLKLRPSVHFRPHEAPVSEEHAGPYTLTAVDHRYELSANAALPPLRMYLHAQGPAFTIHAKHFQAILYRPAQSRPYEPPAAPWPPAYLRV